MIRSHIIGYIGKDATISTPSKGDKKVINFSVASEEKGYQGGNLVKITTWVNCSYWLEKPAIAEHLKKGVQVYVEGNISAKAYESNGRWNASLQLNVTAVKFLSNTKPSTEEQQNEAVNSSPAPIAKEEAKSTVSNESFDDKMPDVDF